MSHQSAKDKFHIPRAQGFLGTCTIFYFGKLGNLDLGMEGISSFGNIENSGFENVENFGFGSCGNSGFGISGNSGRYSNSGLESSNRVISRKCRTSA